MIFFLFLFFASWLAAGAVDVVVDESSASAPEVRASGLATRPSPAAAATRANERFLGVAGKGGSLRVDAWDENPGGWQGVRLTLEVSVGPETSKARTAHEPKTNIRPPGPLEPDASAP